MSTLSRLLVTSFLTLGVASAASAPRETFDFGWKFKYFGPGDPAMAGSPIQTDSYQGGHIAANAIDGNPDTRWCADNFNTGHKLTLTPGITDKVKEVKITLEKPVTLNLHVEYCADGREKSKDIKTDGKEELTLPIGGKALSELSLTFNGTNKQNWASVREIQLIGIDGKPLTINQQIDPYAPAQPDFNDRAQLIPGIEKAESTRIFRSKLQDKGFRNVQLPHDWAIESPFIKTEPNETGKLPWNGWGWYRKQFDVPASFSKDRNRWYLDFDGVMSHPKVFVNGKLAGEWAYGYSSFRVDITPYLEPGKRNIVAVMVSNLPLSTRWYPGSGIYRHVWLVKKEPVHIGQWGVHITTPEVSGERATVSVETTVDNTGSSEKTVQVSQSIGAVKAAPEALTIPAGESRSITQQLVLDSPKLWDTEHPNLYSVKTSVTEGDTTLDTADTTFGVRTIEWKSDGFYLNGKRQEIKGVCEHHDFGGLGSAFYEKAYERKIKKLREMGCNAIRMTHNPPAPEVLDLCDRYGMLAVDELFDVWKHQKYDKKNGYHVDWPQWWQKDVRNLVMRDRNHPSVILWIGGNEVTELDRPDGPEISNALREEFRKYDTSRPYSVGCNNHGIVQSGFADTLDVAGFNYRPWFYKSFHEQRPNIPFYGSETNSCIGTRDSYIFPLSWEATKNDRDYVVSAYGTAATGWGACPDIEYKAQDENPDDCGMFVWTGFDYHGEPTPYNQDKANANNFSNLSPAEREAAIADMMARGEGAPSRSSYFGIIDLAGFPKDIYYLYQSRWLPEQAQAHILPHWNWKGREGQVTPVMVFSSGDEAELFLNGKSQGVRKRGDGGDFTQSRITLPKNSYRFVWEDVKYEPGRLTVVVKKNGKPWATAERHTTGAAESMVLKPDKKTLCGDGRDLVFIELAAVDKKGDVVPTAECPVRFSVSGPAELIGFCNGDPTDQTCEQDPNQKFFNGRVLAIVRGIRGRSGKVTVTARSEQLGTHKLNLEVQAPTADQLRH